MIELFARGIKLVQQFLGIALQAIPADIKFQMIAVGTNDGLLLSRIAPRFIESCSRFRLTEDIHNSVITDAVACDKARMSIVVKCAPPNTACILWIGRQLIVDLCMAEGMLPLPLVIIGRLRWEGMPDKLRVQIARIIWHLKRKLEAIHSEYVFEKLRILEVSNSTRL